MNLKMSDERKVAFLAALAATCNVTRACEAISIARVTAYEWRDNDEQFAAAWVKAREIGAEALEDEATRRAFEGTDKPVFHMGRECGAVREYSDTLAIFLLKGAKPEKYRERAQVDLSNTDGTLQVDEATRSARVAQLLAMAQKRKDETDSFGDLA
jgi:hypothetical protein